jgi:hypothetical protein
MFATLVAVTALLAASPSQSGAQTVVVTPAPVVRYAPPPPVVVMPAPVTVTTYRYGVLPRRRVVVQTYSAPAPVVVVRPARPVRYYRRVYVSP